ncbi:hypothetical protein ACRRTK_024684 [Alexandromys fortis]
MEFKMPELIYMELRLACNSILHGDSPDDSGPTRCCSMRSSPANPDAPGRAHQAPIGCRHRSASPHSCYRAPKVVLGAKKTETAISGEKAP